MDSQGNKTTDRRIARTKEALVDALVSLTNEKPLHSISIAELTREANINRATFYLHYQDINAMVESIQHEVCEEIANLIRVDENAQIVDINAALSAAFRTFDKRRDFFAAMFGVNGDRNFTDKVIMQLWDCLSQLDNSPIPKADREAPRHKPHSGSVVKDAYYYYIFYANGFIGLIKTWIIEGGQESTEEVAAIAEKMLATFNDIEWF